MIHRYGGAGAVWDIFQRQDVPLLQQYLMAHCTEFTHAGKPVKHRSIKHAVHSQVSQYPCSKHCCFHRNECCHGLNRYVLHHLCKPMQHTHSAYCLLPRLLASSLLLLQSVLAPILLIIIADFVGGVITYHHHDHSHHWCFSSAKKFQCGHLP